MRGDDIEISFDDDRCALTHNGRARKVETEEHGRLVVQGGIRRVEVFRDSVSHRTPAESEGRPALVADRKHEPVAEPVACLAARRLSQSRVHHLLQRRPAAAGQIAKQGIARASATGSEAHSGPTRQIRVDAAFFEPLATLLTCRRRPQHVRVVQLRARIQLEGAPPPPAGAPASVLDARLEFDSSSLGEHLQRLAEVDSLDALDELEEVTALLAAEAIPDLQLLADREGRRLLGVEGTQPLELAAAALQSDVPADDIDDVE